MKKDSWEKQLNKEKLYIPVNYDYPDKVDQTMRPVIDLNIASKIIKEQIEKAEEDTINRIIGASNNLLERQNANWRFGKDQNDQLVVKSLEERKENNA